MHISNSPRPIDWPSLGSRTARTLGWLHFIGTLLSVWACLALGWVCYAAGIVAGLVVVVAFLVLAVPIAAACVLGWLFHRLARWFASC